MTDNSAVERVERFASQFGDNEVVYGGGVTGGDLRTLLRLAKREPDEAMIEDWPVGVPALNAAWEAVMGDERIRIGGMPSLHQIRLIIGHTHRAMQDASLNIQSVGEG